MTYDNIQIKLKIFRKLCVCITRRVADYRR